jgi:hypothetical protein
MEIHALSLAMSLCAVIVAGMFFRLSDNRQ